MMEYQPRGQEREPASRLTGRNGEATFTVEGELIRIQFVERLTTGETVNRMTLALSRESATAFMSQLRKAVTEAEYQRMRNDIDSAYERHQGGSSQRI